MKKRALAIVLSLAMAFSLLPMGAMAASSLDGFYWPLVSAKTITSKYAASRSDGPHQGIDIGADAGTAIYAAKDGTVYAAGYHSSMGNYVCIKHSSNVYTTYMHMKTTPYVTKGQQVTVNTQLGIVGSTGQSSGNHLHFHICKTPTSPAHTTTAQLNRNYYDPTPGVVNYTYRDGTTPPGPTPTTPTTPTINLTKYPTTINKGSSFGLYGTVTSGKKITSVQGSVINASGKTVLTSTDKPNATSMDINKSNLNNKITFNKLVAGTYTLKVVAKDADGKSATWSKDFTVAETLKINFTQYPTSIKKGKCFGLYGTVSSTSKITSVQGSVINASGKTVLSSTDKPNATSMNINKSNLNNKITFNTLAKGSYTLKVVAKDAMGSTVTWSKTFKVT